MIELGLLAGDPCAADGWGHEQQVRAYAWWLARAEGHPSAWAFGQGDLVRVWTEIVQGFEGLRRFLVHWGVRRK
jgi:hypothetical protein